MIYIYSYLKAHGIKEDSMVWFEFKKLNLTLPFTLRRINGLSTHLISTQATYSLKKVTPWLNSDLENSFSLHKLCKMKFNEDYGGLSHRATCPWLTKRTEERGIHDVIRESGTTHTMNHSPTPSPEYQCPHLRFRSPPSPPPYRNYNK